MRRRIVPGCIDRAIDAGAGITEWNEFFNNSFGSNPPDDAGFLRALIVTLQGQRHPDARRIYVTGLSNGGFMAHRAAIQIADLVAAIAVAEGTVVSPGSIQNVPAPLGPVSVLMLHGDEDGTVLYCGGQAYASQEQSFNYWSTDDIVWNFCAGHPKQWIEWWSTRRHAGADPRGPGCRTTTREESVPRGPALARYQRYVMRTKNVFALYGSLAYPV